MMLNLPTDDADEKKIASMLYTIKEHTSIVYV